MFLQPLPGASCQNGGTQRKDLFVKNDGWMMGACPIVDFLWAAGADAHKDRGYLLGHFGEVFAAHLPGKLHHLICDLPRVIRQFCGQIRLVMEGSSSREELHLTAPTKKRRHPLADLHQPLFGHSPILVGERPYAAGEDCGLWDGIVQLPCVEGADGEYQRVLWVGLPGVYLLKGQKNMSGDVDRVYRILWNGAMPSLAGDSDRKLSEEARADPCRHITVPTWLTPGKT